MSHYSIMERDIAEKCEIPNAVAWISTAEVVGNTAKMFYSKIIKIQYTLFYWIKFEVLNKTFTSSEVDYLLYFADYRERNAPVIDTNCSLTLC